MAENVAQFEILIRVLRGFQESGVLKEIMLIGSWCLYFYQFYFEDRPQLAPVRTLDLDFLIPPGYRSKKEADIPEILKAQGFLPVFNRASGMVKYGHPELQVEFLIPELGKGGRSPRFIPRFHIKAQPLRYLNFLTQYPVYLQHDGLDLQLPEPGAFALHKLIVSQRRAKEEKAARDLEGAVGLLKLLFSREREKKRVLTILKELPPKWREKILSVSKKHFPPLNEGEKGTGHRT